jgi:tripartite-type tricarboxylate transporter receptor subunit TctC
MKVNSRFSHLCAAMLVAVSSHAMAFPDKPITVIVPFPPGGSSDIVARAITAKAGELLGQPMIVENKPGANGAIGASQAARAAPDGYTLLVGSIGVLSVNPVLYKKLSYDTKRDFDLLTLAVRTPNVLVTRTDFPANNVAGMVDYLKKNPGKVSFAASGIGSSDHLTAALFMQKTGTTGIHATFNGTGPTLINLIGGHADVSFRNLGEVVSQIKAGKLKLLAVAADRRVAEFPDAPTLTEAGVDGVQVFSWQGLAAPKGIPKQNLDKLQRAVVAALKDPAVTKALNGLGFEVVASSSSQFSEFQAAEQARWKSTIENAAISVE